LLMPQLGGVAPHFLSAVDPTLVTVVALAMVLHLRAPAVASPTPPTSAVLCQVCMKLGHTTNICSYQFDEDYVPASRVVAMESSSTSNEPNWYLDSSATDHITGELKRLTMHDHYKWGRYGYCSYW
jgi:hypothetical protein